MTQACVKWFVIFSKQYMIFKCSSYAMWLCLSYYEKCGLHCITMRYFFRLDCIKSERKHLDKNNGEPTMSVILLMQMHILHKFKDKQRFHNIPSHCDDRKSFVSKQFNKNNVLIGVWNISFVYNVYTFLFEIYSKDFLSSEHCFSPTHWQRNSVQFDLIAFKWLVIYQAISTINVKPFKMSN